MRVVVVNTHFAPITYGGATLVAEETSVRLAAHGHEVIIVTTLPERLLGFGEIRRYEARGLPVVAIGRTTASTTDAEYHQPALGRRMRQILQMVRPDVVHFHAVQGLGVESVRASQTIGLPTVITLHDAWWLCERQFMIRATGEWCGQTAIDPDTCATCVADSHQHRSRQQESLEILNAADRVLTPSDYWRLVMAGSGVANRVLRKNPNGVIHPSGSVPRQRTSKGPITFGYVGGGDAVKGAHQLRAALRELGGGDYRVRLVDASTSLKLGGMDPQMWNFPGVQIDPAYSAETMDAFFDSIDVLLFPSQTRESYGLTVREAVLRGVWVVATEGGGTADILTEGVNATLIPMDGTHDALTAAMRAIISDSDLYRSQADPRSSIPTFEDQALSLSAVYREVIAEKRPTVPEPRVSGYSSSPA